MEATTGSQIIQHQGITLEYKQGPRMVVFSHGFGVRRDTSGFFTEIAANLPSDYGWVMFDYYQTDKTGKIVFLTTLHEQSKKLNTVLEWVRSSLQTSELDIIAHSMGCLVPTLSPAEHISHNILLAPPTDIGERTEMYFTSQPGAQPAGDYWMVPRTDGTISHIPMAVFEEYKQLDSFQLIDSYANRHPSSLIIAEKDQINPVEAYLQIRNNKLLDSYVVQGADHDFNGEPRKELLQIIRGILI